jgi:hypothetical protein
MNTKQIAELCEKDTVTIQRWINKVFPTKIENGKETQLSLDEVRQLFDKAFGSKISSMLMEATVLQNAEVTSAKCRGVPNYLGVHNSSFSALAQQVAQQGALLAKIIQDNEIRDRVIVSEIKNLKRLQIEDQSVSHAKELLRRINTSTDKELDSFIDETNGAFGYLYK